MNLAERFDAHPPESTALITPEGTVSYGELADRVGRWHGGLEATGLTVGDRVLIVAGNSEIFVAGYLSCLSAGLVAVPVNPAAPPAELAREIALVEPAAAIVDTSGHHTWAGLDDSVRAGVAHTFLADRGALPTLDAGDRRPVRTVDGDTPAVLLFTSGTAGTPRPAILTHDNLWFSLQSMLALDIPLRTPGQVVLAVIPLFHVFGLNVVVNLGLAIGASLVIEDFESPRRTVELVRATGVTVIAGPPTLWAGLAAEETSSRAAFETVRFAVSGAAALAPGVTAAVAERLGLQVAEGYGLTETGGVITTALGTAAPVGSVGGLVPGVELRLVDDEGNDVLIGDPGEVWARGPMISPGYWNDSATTAAARTSDGWLTTGDLAIVDDHGFLSIVDRLKDLVIVSGFNVHPAEVEAVLNEHEGVEMAAVLGEADVRTGERVVAHVVRRAGAVEATDAELIEHCRTGLARYKVPARVVFVDELPTGLGGKLRRGAVPAPPPADD